ncbi:Na+/H+ antiporter NhaC family protein [Allorhodopirellula solitaria]|uniref:Malate-2H(+)/Na(+)-lactate antiporter n=1 Tax=Allorhodopirellula solitaria TaxID=2527987 RepID=A0A5C5X8N7_9BACT|nr:Na+/H+ antiporter NhaC family protein [Allorhodopirellula solitaria]TWT59300.1 Malate-2H(+)/Na(+)-lactate antiporter [Allorhodopirellula solitaria]
MKSMDDDTHPSDESRGRPDPPSVPESEGADPEITAQPEMAPDLSTSSPTARRVAVAIVVFGLLGSLYAFARVDPQWQEQKTTYNVYENDAGHLVYTFKGEETPVEDVVPYEESPLRQEALQTLDGEPPLSQQWVVESVPDEGADTRGYSLLETRFHFGLWSLLPAAVAIGLCLITKEPLTALLSAVVVGAFMLGRFDITDAVLLPSLASESAATILLLYLWLLGGLMGIWSRTGAAQAFAEFMTAHFVKGPRSAKLVAWLMGIVFFQGGTVSVVLVGTIVTPVADKEKVSHEELAYIVDSTASPIASVLAFNAWPIYIQALIFVPGVSFLATESDRIAFFFQSVPFSFYGILAVTGTFLLSIGITRFSGRGIRAASERARTTGQLDAPGATPTRLDSAQLANVPRGYRPNVLEFFIPLLLLIGTAVSTFYVLGTPKVNWAFGAALLLSVLVALAKGMRLSDVIAGVGDGLKGVVVGSVILMLAVTIGSISSEVGAGVYLVDLLGDRIPYIALPVALQLITMVIAFSTGTSWGTYAIAFPLAMPLAWNVATASGISNPELFMSVCFATVLNGSVYGDQCSPISDTTILSAMTTGCDLTDHVKTQIVPASYAAALAAAMWTATVALFA